MNTRIKEVRTAVGIKQEDFAKALGLSRNFISLLECGERIPSERTIKDICRTYDVNETWLRTGEGEMFLPKDLDDELAEFMGSVLAEDINVSLRKRIIDLMAHIPPELWEAIAEVAKERAAKYREGDDGNKKEG